MQQTGYVPFLRPFRQRPRHVFRALRGRRPFYP